MNQLKKIGILGGMGPQVTLFFLNNLFKLIRDNFHPQKDQDYPDITVLFESSTPDRTQALISGSSESDRIEKGLQQLSDLRCELLTIPCITAHAFVKHSWFDRGLLDFRNIILERYGSVTGIKIGVIATTGSLKANVFNPLKSGFDINFPDDETQALIMRMIYGSGGLKDDKIDVGMCNELVQLVLTQFKIQGCNSTIAGCTEVEEFISSEEIAGDFIFPMQLLLNELIQRIPR